MPETPAQDALGSAVAALVVAAGCTVLFMPPLLDHTTSSVLRTVLTGVAPTLRARAFDAPVLRKAIGRRSTS